MAFLRLWGSGSLFYMYKDNKHGHLEASVNQPACPSTRTEFRLSLLPYCQSARRHVVSLLTCTVLGRVFFSWSCRARRARRALLTANEDHKNVSTTNLEFVSFDVAAAVGIVVSPNLFREREERKREKKPSGSRYEISAEGSPPLHLPSSFYEQKYLAPS